MTLEEIRDKKLGAVINAKTKNEALLLVKILGVDKSRLYDETDFIDVWDAFKENTCYRVVDGKVDMSDCVKYYQSINEKNLRVLRFVCDWRCGKYLRSADKRMV